MPSFERKSSVLRDAGRVPLFFQLLDSEFLIHRVVFGQQDLVFGFGRLLVLSGGQGIRLAACAECGFQRLSQVVQGNGLVETREDGGCGGGGSTRRIAGSNAELLVTVGVVALLGGVEHDQSGCGRG